MKKTFFILLLLIPFVLNATKYYVKNGGSDAAAGTSDGTAWENISKVNSVWLAGTFVPGDSILFKRGSTFSGTIVVSEAGTSGNPIIIGAYGTGIDPIISGFTEITAWTDNGGNIWESTAAASTLTYTNMVVIADTNRAMGRYPNTVITTDQNLLYYSEQLNVTGYATGHPWGAFNNTTITADQAVDVAGNTTMELITIAGGSASIYQSITVVPGNTYTLSWDVKRGTKTALVYSVFDRTNVAYITSPVSYYAETSGTVARLTKTFEAPAGCTNAEVILISNDGDYTQGTVYLGRVQVSDRAGTYVKTTSMLNDGYQPYLSYESFVTNTTITSTALNDAVIDWTGAELVMRKYRWIIDRSPITDHTGSTLTYTSPSSYYGQDDWGFFIQNDLECLDIQDEWYYNPSTKKLSVYSTAEPTNALIPTVDTLVQCDGFSYITFDNITFEGSNYVSVYIYNSQRVTIQNCTFSFSGQNAISGYADGNSNYFSLLNSTISNSGNNAINLPARYDYATIDGNTISNTGMIAGMGGSNDDQYIAIALTSSTGSLIQHNNILHTGYNGIHFPGYASGSVDNTVVTENFVNYFCEVKDDGGGIYTHTEGTGKVISYNVVINGIGNKDGTNDVGGAEYDVMGIYLDRNYSTSGVTVTYNSVAHIGNAGIFLNGTHSNTITYNTFFDCAISLRFGEGNPGDVVSGNVFNNNQYIAKNATQLVTYGSSTTDIFTTYTSDNNKYSRPIDNGDVFKFQLGAPTWVWTLYTFSEWQTYSGEEANSYNSPVTTADTANIHFVYNGTSSGQSYILSATMVDITNASHSGNISMVPYSSLVLVGAGTIKRIRYLIINGKLQTVNGKLVTITQ